MFSLVNPSGSKPVKISQNPDARVGILPDKDMGPNFGIKHPSKINIHYFNLKMGTSDLHGNFKCQVFSQAPGFLTPTNVNLSTYLIGKEGEFVVSELEVFKVSLF